MKIALLFPGQGSQSESFFEENNEHFFRFAEKTYHDFFKAHRSLEPYSLQASIVIQSLAIYYRLLPFLKKHTLMFCGHSLGELSAASILNGWSKHDSIALAAYREYLMRSVSEETDLMIALLGNLDREAIEAACNPESSHGPWIINDNSPTQCVVGGNRETLSIFNAPNFGIKKSIPLKTTGLSHCSRMSSIVDMFKEKLATYSWRSELEHSLLSTTDLKQIECGMDLKNELCIQLTNQVRFREAITHLEEVYQPDCYIEIGPGQVLSNLVSKMYPNARCYSSHQHHLRDKIYEEVFHG